MWIEDTSSSPPNRQRVLEVAAAGVSHLATACPVCLTMLGDGLKKEGLETIWIFDMAELVSEACLPTESETFQKEAVHGY